MIIPILTASILFQLAAAFLALRLIPVTGKRNAWILISTAILLMVLRRCMSLYEILFTGQQVSSVDISAEWIALGTSVLMFLGIIRISNLFHSIQDSKKKLEKSQARYQSLFAECKDAVYETSREGDIIEVNQSFLDLFGYNREDVVNMNIKQIYPSPENRQLFQLKVEYSGFVKDYEVTFMKKDKTEIDCLLTSSVRVHNGIVQGYRGIIHDITHRKKMEKALRESEAMFRALTESTASGIFIIQGEKFHYVNPSAECISGYSKENLLTKNYNDIIHIDFKETIKNLLAKISLGQELYLREEVKIVTQKGREKWIDLTITPLKFKGHSSILVSAFDITKTKQAEQELRENEKKYRLFFEEDLTGDYITTIDGCFIACNSALAKMLGCSSPEEVLKYNAAEFYPDRGSMRPRRLDLIREKRKFEYHETTYKRKDNELLHVIENVIGIFDEQDELMYIKGYVFDITESKKMEKQLRQSQKMEAIGTLAGGIAHDFNNILVPIIGYAEMGMMKFKCEKIQKYMQEIFKAASRAKELVQQILTFSRQTEHEKVSLKIQPVIKEALKLLRATIPTTIEFYENIDPKCRPIMADPVQIHQIIMNLCTNASHAMKKDGGKLEIGLSEVYLTSRFDLKSGMKEGVYLRLVVSDTGQGIKPEIMERVFEPYFTTKEKGRGTGLGLAVVHGIVKNFQGDIKIYSETGKGTTVHTYLPITNIKAINGKTEEKIMQGNERILLVDDEKPIIEMTTEMLETLGYKVTSFTDSKSALKAFNNHPDDFDLVITDQTMPHITGTQLAHDMMKIRPNLPIILCSGFSEIVTSEYIQKSNIYKYLMKPVNAHDIAKTIRNALDNKLF